jgi:hypothetical protein
MARGAIVRLLERTTIGEAHHLPRPNYIEPIPDPEPLFAPPDANNRTRTAGTLEQTPIMSVAFAHRFFGGTALQSRVEGAAMALAAPPAEPV